MRKFFIATLATLILTLYSITYVEALHFVDGPNYSKEHWSIESQVKDLILNVTIAPTFFSINKVHTLEITLQDVTTARSVNTSIDIYLLSDYWFFSSMSKSFGQLQPHHNIYRSELTFEHNGEFIIRLAFLYKGENIQVDFPITVGQIDYHWLLLGLSVFLILLFTIIAKLRSRRLINGTSARGEHP